MSCLSNFAFAQGGASFNSEDPKLSDEETLRTAVVLILDGHLYEGDKLVDDLLIKEPDNLYYNYLKGFNTLYSAKDHAKAISYFQKTIDPVQGKLELLSSESNVTNDVYFHVATAYHFLEDFDNAEKYYNIFKEMTSKRSILAPEVDIRLAQCAVGRRMIANPEDSKVELIQGPINSELAEYSPVISANGRELYFTSRRDWKNKDLSKYRYPVDNSFPEDIYCSVLDKDNYWTEPERLSLCDAYKNEASVYLTSNMNTLFVYSDKEGNGNLFSSEYGNNHFGSIDQLTYEKLNSKSWEPHYVSSDDSTLIIFSSDRKGGEGGRDLWSMYQQDDGSWTEPMNMGPSINSSEDEDAPFISLDGEYLYFASNGVKSMGGFDIFRSKINDKGEADTPENMGVPINSAGDDLFFSLTHDGTDAYFSSFRKNGVGENDIYHLNNSKTNIPANVIALQGRVIDISLDAEPVTVSFTLLNNNTNESHELSVNHSSYFQLLEPCGDYTLTMTDVATNEILSQEDIKTDCEVKPTTIERNYYNGYYWIEGVFADAETKAAISASSIEIIDSSTDGPISAISANAGGFASEKLEDYREGDFLDFSVRITADGYQPKTIEVGKILGGNGKVSVEMELEKIPLIASLEDQINEYIIYFDYDKSNIRSSEQDVMNEVIALMNANPELEIRLLSHTDSRGTNAYNQRLSDSRAKSSLKFIQSKITNPKRIQAKGVGETMPAVNCEECSDEQHQKNRRTTFEIIK
ncbi:MAG: OmpA family protein [Crocinitomicaceae bacterium]|nr:OmpA family protein [Crocinitomicaceae bacterium]